MALKHEAVRGAAWTAFSMVATQGVAVLTFLVLARLLAPEVFGIVALANVYTQLALMLVGQGLGATLIQRKDIEPDHLNSAFWFATLSGCALAAALAFGAGPIARWHRQPELESALPWLSLVFVFAGAAAVPSAVLRRTLAFRALANRGIWASLVASTLAIILALRGFGVWGLVAQQVVRAAADFVIALAASGWRPRLRWSWPHLRELFPVSRAFFVLNVLHTIVLKADDFIIGSVMGPRALGFYAVAYRLLRLLQESLNRTTISVALPVFARVQQEPERAERGLLGGTELISQVAFPVCFGVSAVAPDLVPTLFGSQWLPSVPVMQVLAIAVALQSSAALMDQLMMAMGRIGPRVIFAASITALYVLGFAIAVRFGLLAVAVAYLITNIVAFPARLLVVRRLFNVDAVRLARSMVPPFLASVLMVAAIAALRSLIPESMAGARRLAILIAAGALVYPGVLWVIARESFARTALLIRKA